MIVIGDIEADGLYDDVTTIWCAVFLNAVTGQKHYFYPQHVHSIPKFLDKVDTLVMHNGSQYDLPVIEKILDYKFQGNLIDTLAISRMEKPLRQSHSLDSWGLTLNFRKTKFDEWDKFSEEMIKYCANDVDLTFRVAQHLKAIESTPTRYYVVSSLFSNLWKQELNGWRIDKVHMHKSVRLLEHWKSRITRVTLDHLPTIVTVPKISYEVKKPFKKDGTLSYTAEKYCEKTTMEPKDICGPFSRVDFRRVSLDKPKELKDFLLELGWKPELWNYNKEGIKTSPKLSIEDPFEGIQSSLGKLIVKYTQCKQRLAILHGWLNKIREDDRLPSKVVGLAVTSRARHSIIANIPRSNSFFGKQMRKVFIAKEGWMLVGADSVNCQLRMLAARMQDEEYTQRILNEDIHNVHAELVGITRTDAKTLIYATIFGASTAKLSRMLGYDARSVRDRLYSSMPGLRTLLRKKEEEWKGTAKTRMNRWGKLEYYDGYVIGLDGRNIPVNSGHKILMGLLQSDEAILMQYAYNMYHNKLRKAGLEYGIDYGVCCWYHDEITSECKPELAHTIGRMKCEAIKNAGKFLDIPCPMEGEYKVGHNWSEIH